VIVREDLMGNVVKNQPILFDYATQANNDSMYNISNIGIFIIRAICANIHTTITLSLSNRLL
jgi:phosphoserine aminotransferase